MQIIRKEVLAVVYADWNSLFFIEEKGSPLLVQRARSVSDVLREEDKNGQQQRCSIRTRKEFDCLKEWTLTRVQGYEGNIL